MVLKTRAETFVGKVNAGLPPYRRFPEEISVAEAMLGLYMDYGQRVLSETGDDWAVKAAELMLELFQQNNRYVRYKGPEYEGLPMTKLGEVALQTMQERVWKEVAVVVREIRRKNDANAVTVQRPSPRGPLIVEEHPGTV